MVNYEAFQNVPYISETTCSQDLLVRLGRRVMRLGRVLEQRGGGMVSRGIFTERMAELPEFIQRVKAANPQTPILDVGCAESFMPLHYIAMGYEVDGVDLRGAEFSVRGFRHLQGDAATLQFDRRYEVITLLSTLEHCGSNHYGGDEHSDDVAVIANLRRFLQPGGRFICSVPFGVAKDMSFFRVYDETRLLRAFGNIDNTVYYRFDSPMWYRCEQADIVDFEHTGFVEAIVVFDSLAD